MSTIQIHVFISHSWSYSGHYDTLAGWIFNHNWSAGQASFNFLDFSVSRNDPVHNTNNDTQLRQALYNKIARSHVIVIPTGMYTKYSKWIQKEIEGANEYSKPILAVNLWGAQRTSTDVSSVATKIVSWNAKSVVNAICELYK